MIRATIAALGLCLIASPVSAQTVAPGLTEEQVAASEAMAPSYDESATREQARLKTFKDRPLGGFVQKTFDVVANYTAMAAKMMPESGYDFRPTPDLRTFAEQINHATGAQYFFCNQAGVPPGFSQQSAPDLSGVTSKADIIEALEASIDYCSSLLAAASEEWLMEVVPNVGGPSSGLIEGMRAYGFIYNAIHTGEDYGTVTLYLRMQGVVPPSTALHPPRR